MSDIVKLIKVGDRLINRQAIAHVDLRAARHAEQGVKITMLSGDSLFFTENEARALRLHFEFEYSCSDLNQTTFTSTN
jgi:D-aminopeptidase